MTIPLEWVRLPNETDFCNNCRSGILVPAPTRYLLFYVHPDYGSTHTARTYAQWLLPFFKWLDRHQIALPALTGVDHERFRRGLTLVTTSGDPLLQQGADPAPSTLHNAVGAAARFIIWAVEYSDTESLLYGGQAVAAMIVQARVPRTGECSEHNRQLTSPGIRLAPQLPDRKVDTGNANTKFSHQTTRLPWGTV